MAENKSEYKKPIRKTDMDALYPLIEEIIKDGKTVNMKIAGTSMFPLVAHRRDSVVLGSFDKLKKGDVPLYKREDGKYILHRIIKEKDGAFAIMGDFETKIEYPVSKKAVLAVAKGFYRKGKYISCESFSYKAYCFLWGILRPVRPLLLKIIRLVSKIKRKFTK